MAKTAREIMTPDPVCARSSDSVLDAARRMAELGVGSLPICGEDNKLKGLITDRDIVVKVIAAANDPRAVHVGELAQGRYSRIGRQRRGNTGDHAPAPGSSAAGD
jgi:CBS domain-containing protein